MPLLEILNISKSFHPSRMNQNIWLLSLRHSFGLGPEKAEKGKHALQWSGEQIGGLMSNLVTLVPTAERRGLPALINTSSAAAVK